MSALFVRVLWVSLTTSAVLLPALLLEKSLSRRYRPKSCYLLWLLLCLRLLIPVEIPLPCPAVTVDHPDGRSTLYAHLKEVHVESGTVVAAGQALGLVGQTGAATGVHLHFEVR